MPTRIILNFSTAPMYSLSQPIYAGLLINTYSTKTKNRTNKNEKKMLRRTGYLLRVTSFLKVDFMCGFLDSWTIHGQDNFDFAKTQISVQ